MFQTVTIVMFEESKIMEMKHMAIQPYARAR